HDSAPRCDGRREEDPVAVGRTEFGFDVRVALPLAHPLRDEVAHLACGLGRRVLHRKALADRAAKLGRDLVDALVRSDLMRPRGEQKRRGQRDKRDRDHDATVHRTAPARSFSIAFTSVSSSIGPMCRPAITPSGPMKNVSGGPKTPYESATRPSSSATVVHTMPMRCTYASPLSRDS